MYPFYSLSAYYKKYTFRKKAGRTSFIIVPNFILSQLNSNKIEGCNIVCSRSINIRHKVFSILTINFSRFSMIFQLTLILIITNIYFINRKWMRELVKRYFPKLIVSIKKTLKHVPKFLQLPAVMNQHFIKIVNPNCFHKTDYKYILMY